MGLVPSCPRMLTRETFSKSFKRKEIDEYNVKHACLPPDYDPTGHVCEAVESCKVTFAGPGGVRVHGWLANV